MVATKQHFSPQNSDTRRLAAFARGGSITTPIALPNTDQSRNYTLDGLGNWRATGLTPVGGSSTTDQRNHNYVNEITQRTVGTNSQVVFQYDGTPGASNGNLANDGTLIYSYDALNRPIQIVNEGLVIATYVYDAMNRRVRKAVSNGGLPVNIPDGTTDYIWQGNQVMEERNPFGGSGSTDTPIRQYIWGTYIDECIQLTTLATLGPQSLPAGAYYLLQDLLYRAVALTDFTGTVVEAYDTEAYGNTIIFTSPGTDGVWFTDDDVQSSYGANEIIYCGYPDCGIATAVIGTGLYDPETELYYVRNRTYNPTLGRWIQRDPIGYAGGINLYEYAGGRTTIEADPMGEYAFPNNFVPGMGTFDVTITSEPAAANMPFRSHVQVEFHPSQAIIKQNKNCPICTEIQAIQFANTREYHWWGSSDFFGWHPDKDNPFFPGATPWRFGRPWPLVSSDDPGATWGVRFTSTGIRQEFRLYAVCTAGKDKGKSFGFASWGHEFNWGFWTGGNPSPTRVSVTRWVEGVSSTGTATQNFGVSRVALAPLPGGVSW
jgi:RHS repeat-associated protein